MDLPFLPCCYAAVRQVSMLQVFSLSTSSMADPDGAKLALKRHLGELATLRGRSLGGPLPLLPIAGSDTNDTDEQVGQSLPVLEALQCGAAPEYPFICNSSTLCELQCTSGS